MNGVRRPQRRLRRSVMDDGMDHMEMPDYPAAVNQSQSRARSKSAGKEKDPNWVPQRRVPRYKPLADAPINLSAEDKLRIAQDAKVNARGSDGRWTDTADDVFNFLEEQENKKRSRYVPQLQEEDEMLDDGSASDEGDDEEFDDQLPPAAHQLGNMRTSMAVMNQGLASLRHTDPNALSSNVPMYLRPTPEFGRKPVDESPAMFVKRKPRVTANAAPTFDIDESPYGAPLARRKPAPRAEVPQPRFSAAVTAGRQAAQHIKASAATPQMRVDDDGEVVSAFERQRDKNINKRHNALEALMGGKDFMENASVVEEEQEDLQEDDLSVAYEDAPAVDPYQNYYQEPAVVPQPNRRARNTRQTSRSRSRASSAYDSDAANAQRGKRKRSASAQRARDIEARYGNPNQQRPHYQQPQVPMHDHQRSAPGFNERGQYQRRGRSRSAAAATEATFNTGRSVHAEIGSQHHKNDLGFSIRGFRNREQTAAYANPQSSTAQQLPTTLTQKRMRREPRPERPEERIPANGVPEEDFFGIGALALPKPWISPETVRHDTSTSLRAAAAPQWVVVGSFKTEMGSIADVNSREGYLKWVQRTPKGNYQRMTIPLQYVFGASIEKLQLPTGECNYAVTVRTSTKPAVVSFGFTTSVAATNFKKAIQYAVANVDLSSI